MAKLDLLSELQKRVLICDGAMGTQLMAKGLTPGACGELWNLQNPDAVESIHRAYRQAGCDLITTNTFGASSASLKKHDLDTQAAQINRAGAQIARRAAGDNAWVLGDMGPFGDFLEPLGDMTADQLLDIFQQQAAALYEGGSDAIIVETMQDPAELAVAVKAAKQASSRPVIATYAFSDGGNKTFRTMMGTVAQDAVARAIDAGADVVGTNCGTSLSFEDYLRLAEQLVAAAGKVPVIVQPNAGAPVMSGGKLVYRAQPQDMATIVAPLIKLGVRIIGGCCGTSPDHLRAVAAAAKAQ
ncbi:MAG: homocysteine S-methyltransferase family protein [Bacillota bacterium]